MAISFKPNEQKSEVWDEKIFRNKIDHLAKTDFHGKVVLKENITPKDIPTYKYLIWKVAKHSDILRKALFNVSVKRESALLARMNLIGQTEENLKKDSTFIETYNQAVGRFNAFLRSLNKNLFTNYQVYDLTPSVVHKQQPEHDPCLITEEMSEEIKTHPCLSEWCQQHKIDPSKAETKNGIPLLSVLIRGNNLEGIKWLMTQPDFDPNVVFVDFQELLLCNHVATKLIVSHPQFNVNFIFGGGYNDHFDGCAPLPKVALIHWAYGYDKHLFNCLLEKDSISLSGYSYDSYSYNILDRVVLDKDEKAINKILSKIDLAKFFPSDLQRLAACAAKAGNLTILRELFERFPEKLNDHSDPKIINIWKEAIDLGSKECIDLLITHKHPVNISDSEKVTPLHIAAEKGSLEIVDALLSAGAIVNEMNRPGSPIYVAAEKGMFKWWKGLFPFLTQVNF